MDFWEVVKRVPIYPTLFPLLMTPTFVWYICYDQWTHTHTLLLTEVHTLFRFFPFLPNAPSLFQDLIQDTALRILDMLPLGPDSFSDLSCFWWPWMFWGKSVRIFCRMSLSGIGLMFSWLDGGDGLWEEDHKGKMTFFIISYQGYILLTWPITFDINLEHLAEVLFVKFLRCKVTLFPSSHTTVLEKSNYAQPILK